MLADGFARILRRLPFPVQQVHSDNGSEFLNDHLYRFWRGAADPHLSRGRPAHKNDQRFVEQKNTTLVRAYLGRRRLDSVQQTNALNQLYDQMWLYYNFFQPVMRLVEKTMVQQNEQPTRLKRRFDEAQTPFVRLCAARVLTEDQENALRALHGQTNPRQLRRAIYDGLQALATLPPAMPPCPQDIFETLDQPLWTPLQEAP